MKLPIRELVASEGTHLPIHLSGMPDRDSLQDVDWSVDRVELTGEAFAQLSTVYVDATIHATITQPCNRCLEPVRTVLEIEEPFELPIEPASDAVDLMPMVLQIVLSTYDADALCKPDCRGLCPICGENLNAHPEHHCSEDGNERITLRDYLQ